MPSTRSRAPARFRICAIEGRYSASGSLTGTQPFQASCRRSRPREGRDGRRVLPCRTVQERLEQIVQRFGADTGTLHLVEGGVLVLKGQVGLPPPVIEIVKRVPIGKGMAGLAAERNAPASARNI